MQKTKEKKPLGAPKKIIDWEQVDYLLMAGSSGTEIAAHFGLQPETLYNRCLSDKGINFSSYSQQKAIKGDSLLRAHQYAKALGFTDKGDNTLLIWLGKCRLKQKEEDKTLQAPPNEQIVEKDNRIMLLENKLAKYESQNDNKP